MNRRDGESKLVLDAQSHFASIRWPELKVVSCPKIGQNSCTILCAGFEDRSLASLQSMKREGISSHDLLVIEYLPKYEQNKIDEIRKLADEMSSKVRRLVYDRENPASFGDLLREYCRDYSRVLIDISAMSRLLIVQALVAMLAVGEREISIVYSEAKKYPPDQKTVRRDEKEYGASVNPGYLSSGVFEIATTPELGSVAMLGEPTRLIAFPSFDPAQLSNLIQELQPTHINLIHGIPPEPALRWRTDAVKRLNGEVLSQRELEEEYSISTLEYTETLKVLIDIYNSRSALDRLVIAPTGSKMQAVSVGIFRRVFRDVQIVYPTPQVFSKPEEYTKGVKRVYQLDVPRRLLGNQNGW